MIIKTIASLENIVPNKNEELFDTFPALCSFCNCADLYPQYLSKYIHTLYFNNISIIVGMHAQSSR